MVTVDSLLDIYARISPLCMGCQGDGSLEVGEWDGPGGRVTGSEVFFEFG